MSKPEENSGEMAGRNSKGQFTKGNKVGPRFSPGDVPNPKGRRNAISDIIRKMLDADDGKIREELAGKLIDQARTMSGDDFLKALDRILDRTEGKPTQPTADVTDGWQKFMEGVFIADPEE